MHLEYYYAENLFEMKTGKVYELGILVRYVNVFFFYLQLSLSSVIPDSDSEYSLELDLAHEIVPCMCAHVVTPSKIEVKLRKKEGLRWTQLDGDRKEDSIKAIPQGLFVCLYPKFI